MIRPAHRAGALPGDPSDGTDFAARFTTRYRTGAQRLALAAIEQALIDLELPDQAVLESLRNPQRCELVRSARSAEAWIFRPATGYLYPFELACDAAGFDADAVRAKARAILHRQAWRVQYVAELTFV